MSNTLQIAERVDITEMTFDLSPDMNSPQGLYFFENQLAIAHTDHIDAESRFAYNLYMILKHQLFLHERENAEEILDVDSGNVVLSHKLIYGKNKVKVFDALTGEQIKAFDLRQKSVIWFRDIVPPTRVRVVYDYFPHPTQSDYLRHLDEKHGKGTSTMKRTYGALKTAHTEGYDTPAKIARVGVSVLADTFDAFRTDRDTGEIKDIKDGAIPKGKTPKEYYRESVETLSQGKSLKRGEYVKLRREVLKPGSPNIYIEVYPDGTRAWAYERYHEEMLDAWSGPIVAVDDGKGIHISFLNDPQRDDIPPQVEDYIYNFIKGESPNE